MLKTPLFFTTLDLSCLCFTQSFAENQKHIELNALFGLFAALSLWSYLQGHFISVNHSFLLARSSAGLN